MARQRQRPPSGNGKRDEIALEGHSISHNAWVSVGFQPTSHISLQSRLWPPVSDTIQGYEDALTQPYTRPFDFTGRPMKGWVTVAPGGYESDRDLEGWVQRGIDIELSLPAK